MMTNTNEERRNNKEYAGQLAVVKRNEKNISVKDMYTPVEDAHDKPFLQVLSPFSVNKLNILDTSKRVANYDGQMRNVSLYANIPQQDMADFTKRSDNALMMIMLYEQGLFTPAASTPKSAETTSTKAFDILKVGNWGKAKQNPGDLILTATDLPALLKQISGQRAFLLPNKDRYKNNAHDIEAIDAALELMDPGIAVDVKRNALDEGKVSAFALSFSPKDSNLAKARPSEEQMSAKTRTAGGIRIYPSAKKGGEFNDPTKPFSGEYVVRNKRLAKVGGDVRKNGKETVYKMWYKLIISCDVTRDQPFNIHMENFYAPVKMMRELENPDMAKACKVSEPAKGIDTEEFTMTEQEFTQFVEQMRFNHDSVKRLWYSSARKEDMARRFKPIPQTQTATQ